MENNLIVECLENSKVVIIDDKEEEAKPLIDGLRYKGISTLYIKKVSDIKKALKGIRLIFLDIDLLSGTGNSHDRSGMVTRFLEKLVDKENGPYMMVIWSKLENVHLSSLEARIETFVENGIGYLVPVEKIVLEKNEYIRLLEENSLNFQEENELIEGLKSYLKMEGVNIQDESVLNIQKYLEENPKKDNYEIKAEDLEKLFNEICEKLKNKINFLLFLLWENIVKNEIISQGNDFFDSETIEKIGQIFYNLAVANSGKQLKDEEFISNAIFVINNLLCDKLSSKTKNFEIIKDLAVSFLDEKKNIKKEYKEKLTSETKGELNRKLLLTETLEEISPGTVYEIINCEESEKVINSFYNSIVNHNLLKEKTSAEQKEFKKNLKSKMTYINLEISPLCDYSQNKIKNYRILKGIMMAGDEEADKYISINNISFYKSPLISIDNKLVYLIFSFQELYTEKEMKIDDKKIKFKLKNDLLKEIQVKLSNHVSRLGIISL